MDNKQKNEKLQFIIQRYDTYYSSIGLRGNVYLTVNIGILAGLVTGYFSSDKALRNEAEMSILVIFVLLCNLSAILNTLIALKPFINDKRCKPGYSSVFWGALGGKHTNEKYGTLWQEMDDDKWHEDLKIQATLLTYGLDRKFKALTRATQLIGIQVICVIIFALNILIRMSGIIK